MTWKRLRESEVKEYGGMLPARVVVEEESDRTYRTFLETFNGKGEPGFQHGRFFYTEAEAMEDFESRMGRL